MDDPDFQLRIARLQGLLKDKLRLRGRTLEIQLGRAGRALPSRQRQAGAIILGAQDWMAHPKLARLLDERQVKSAMDDLMKHLEGLDRKEISRTKMRRLLGEIVLRLILLVLAILAVLHWQGVL